MIWFLRLLFTAIIASMLWVTSWASLEQSMFAIPRAVVSNRWFVATLFDAYWGFTTFYVWLAWKEPTLAGRILWFLPIMLLGNIAMSAYMLRELFRRPASASLTELFAGKSAGGLVLPGILLGVSTLVYAVA